MTQGPRPVKPKKEGKRSLLALKFFRVKERGRVESTVRGLRMSSVHW